ncbi:MAG: TonB-dependent receptor [Acidobacteriota bacterium]
MFVASFALLLLPSAVGAQEVGSLAGQVEKSTGRSFVLATARIPDLGRIVDVGEDGSFLFEDLKPGSYLLEVRVPSRGVGIERVSVRAGETSSVMVEISVGSHSEEIVVSASADARSSLELAAPTISLSGNYLELRRESSLGETLALEPGIHSTYFGPGASQPVIRGFTGSRIRILEGGIDTGDVAAVSADHAVTSEPAQADRIEVLRGPGTLLYGSNAIGGVVNVIDERVPTLLGSGGINGSFELRTGSAADERQGTVALGGGGGQWSWNLAATGRESDDYDIPGFARLEEEEHDEDDHDAHEEEEENPFGTVPNSDIETRSVRAGATYFFGDQGFLGVSVSGFDTDYGIPGGHGHGEEHGEEEGEHEEHEEEEHGEEEVRLDMEQRRIDLRGQVNLALAAFEALKVRFGASDYEHFEVEGEEVGTFFFRDFVETRLELIQSQRGRHSGSVGLQFLDGDFEAVGEEAFIPATTTQSWGLFTLQELATQSVTWQLGARFETQESEPVAQARRTHDGLSASLGMVWQANDTFQLAVSGARSVRLPAAEELFADGLHVATRTFEIGDPTLEEEVGLGLDLALRFAGESVSGEVSFFRQRFSDYIFQSFTGVEREGAPLVLYAQEDATFSGIELQGRVEIFEKEDHHVHLSVMGDLVDAELENGENVPRVPPVRLGTAAHYHGSRWNASTELVWVDDQTDVAPNESATDGYTLLNASLGYRLVLGNQVVDLLLRGKNLTDEEARSHTSFLKNEAPLPGRNISLSARLRF